mmetsp:Transcript_31660/g.97883  ORF Transcript_31660/g.97883 Transcript_31660/m.97883 type:complete len:257 (-) Transcript_31660:12-782(-)
MQRLQVGAPTCKFQQRQDAFVREEEAARIDDTHPREVAAGCRRRRHGRRVERTSVIRRQGVPLQREAGNKAGVGADAVRQARQLVRLDEARGGDAREPIAPDLRPSADRSVGAVDSAERHRRGVRLRPARIGDDGPARFVDDVTKAHAALGPDAHRRRQRRDVEAVVARRVAEQREAAERAAIALPSRHRKDALEPTRDRRALRCVQRLRTASTPPSRPVRHRTLFRDGKPRNQRFGERVIHGRHGVSVRHRKGRQ